MAKMFCVDNVAVDKIQELISRKIDQEYYIIQKWNNYADIAQWCDKYQNVRIITVPLDRLDKIMALQ